MTQTQAFLKEIEQEAETTRKMLSIIPEDKYGWKPHEKSMDVLRLATHIAELPGWVAMALTTDELDFDNNPYEYPKINNNKNLLAFFEQSLENGRKELLKYDDSELANSWTLRSGDKIYSVRAKGDVIRMSISQTIHHRAQMGVFLRLLNVPIPGSYGPSADEMNF
jgi:uncharacterized damage-inducible protein DinB